MNHWEHTGSWPEALRQNIIALVPKAGAVHEKRLRPIGLLSYIYRVWMVIRKQHLGQWSRHLHGGRHQVTAELATRARAHMELGAWRGLFSRLAIHDCSKCYERIAHALAGQRAVSSGFPDTAMNLIMHIYSGPRRLRAHGAISRTTSGHHGLIAGCSFAKDILKSFRSVVHTLAMPATFRDYVDDMTLYASGATPDEANDRLRRALGLLTARLTSDNMRLDDSKKQIPGNTKSARDAWNARGAAPAVDVAKDLAVHHCRYPQKHPVLHTKLSQFAATAKRFCLIPTTRLRRASLASAVNYGRCVYGRETAYARKRWRPTGVAQWRTLPFHASER